MTMTNIARETRYLRLKQSPHKCPCCLDPLLHPLFTKIEDIFINDIQLVKSLTDTPSAQSSRFKSAGC